MIYFSIDNFISNHLKDETTTTLRQFGDWRELVDSSQRFQKEKERNVLAETAPCIVIE